jgi:CheY-like chemotaxis protein
VRTRLQQLQRTTADGSSVSEQWTFYPNGAPVTVQAVISAFTLEDGRSVLLFEAASLEVQPQERRAVEALRHTSSLITLFTLDGRALFTNPAAIATYGPACSFFERFAAAGAGERLLAAVRSGAVLSELLQVKTVAGVRFHHLDARSVLDPATGEGGVLLSERDVTLQVEAERGLLAAEDRAAAAIAKQRFLAGVSHDLRTPLNSIIGYADMLSLDAEGEIGRSRAARIAGSGRMLLELINALIDLSELDSGGVTLEARPFALRGLLTRALGASAPPRPEGAATVLEIDAGVPDALIGDPERLYELVTRLVTLDPAPPGGGRVLSVSLISIDGAGASLELALRGPVVESPESAADGDLSWQSRRMRGAVLQALFGLFAGTGSDGPQTGQDEAETSPRLRLDFPLAAPGAEEPVDLDGEEPEEDDLEPDGPGKPLNILYADDHENNRILVQSILASQGHHCETVCDGAEAVAAADIGAYDLVLLDVQMPVMDGVSAASNIRALLSAAAGVPILALTANTLSADRARYLAAGMNDCLAKPLNFMELIQKVEHWSRRPI